MLSNLEHKNSKGVIDQIFLGIPFKNISIFGRLFFKSRVSYLHQMQGSFGIVDYMYLISSSLINSLKTILNYCLRFKFMYSLFDREYVLVLRVFFMYSLIVRCPSGASTGVHVPTIEKTRNTLTNDMIFRSRTDMLP